MQESPAEVGEGSKIGEGAFTKIGLNLSNLEVL